jgi:hypothetical protein
MMDGDMDLKRRVLLSMGKAQPFDPVERVIPWRLIVLCGLAGILALWGLAGARGEVPNRPKKVGPPSGGWDTRDLEKFKIFLPVTSPSLDGKGQSYLYNFLQIPPDRDSPLARPQSPVTPQSPESLKNPKSLVVPHV